MFTEREWTMILIAAAIPMILIIVGLGLGFLIAWIKT